MLRLHVGGRHAATMQDVNMVIADKGTGKVEEQFEHYRPVPQDPNAPITDANMMIRDRWIGSIIKWIVPRDLWEAEDNAESQSAIKSAMDEQKIELSVSPGGCMAMFTRDGETLAVWSAVQ